MLVITSRGVRPAVGKPFEAPCVISVQTGSVLEGKNATVSKASILRCLPPVCELNGVFPENGVFPRWIRHTVDRRLRINFK